jgi:hypothetical protein
MELHLALEPTHGVLGFSIIFGLVKGYGLGFEDDLGFLNL